jgi:uncharacterized protein YdhG (YjbR/CyaY superfamily)
MAAIKFKTVEQYFSTLSGPAKTSMVQMRETILKAAPGAEEVISYNMPAFRYHGMLVWYAAFARHIGFYPRASGIEAFKKELAGYKNAKGSVQFPIDEKLPVALITKMVKYRVKENGASQGKSGR